MPSRPGQSEGGEEPSLAKYRQKNLPEHQYQTETAGPREPGGTNKQLGANQGGGREAGREGGTDSDVLFLDLFRSSVFTL